VALVGTVKVILEPVPVLNEGSPSPVRSMYQLRFVPDPVAVTVWPGVKVVPCAGEIMAMEAVEVMALEAAEVALEAADKTVRLNLVVFVTPPPAPVTDTVYVPAGVEVAVATVNRLEQVGLHVFREKEALAPEGSPDAEKETAWGHPLSRFAVIVLVAADPWATDRLVEFASEKLKASLLPWS
jgi:hypothetical protein